LYLAQSFSQVTLNVFPVSPSKMGSDPLTRQLILIPGARLASSSSMISSLSFNSLFPSSAYLGGSAAPGLPGITFLVQTETQILLSLVLGYNSLTLLGPNFPGSFLINC